MAAGVPGGLGHRTRLGQKLMKIVHTQRINIGHRLRNTVMYSVLHTKMNTEEMEDLLTNSSVFHDLVVCKRLFESIMVCVI